MKKLNRKGFTLIELLAVIVILAIVLVVTIPSVIGTMNDARDKNLQNATDSVAEWFTKQYELNVLGNSLDSGIGTGTVDSAFKDFVGTTGLTSAPKQLTNPVLAAAGVANAENNIDVTNSSVSLNGDKICVKLRANQDGSFYNTASGYNNCKLSGGCAGSSVNCS